MWSPISSLGVWVTMCPVMEGDIDYLEVMYFFYNMQLHMYALTLLISYFQLYLSICIYLITRSEGLIRDCQAFQ